MADRVERLERMSPDEKRALVSELLARKSTLEQHPTSYGQRALWFVYRLDPSSPAYNIAARWQIDSAVNVGALHAAFGMLADRHMVLRTTFDSVDGEPVQRVRPSVAVDFVHVDASGWTSDRLDAHLAEEAKQPFDLGRAPAFRIRLFTRGANDHLLQLTFHHIIYDLGSGAQLARELPGLYAAACRGDAAPASVPKVRFADYVHWQRALIDGADGKRHWEYWKTQLAGPLPLLDLPTDRPRPPVQTYEGSSHDFQLPARLAADVRALARAEGTTPYTILLAAFFALLYRHTMQEDVVIGTPSWGRNHTDFDRLVGYFVNPLVLRARVDGSAPFTNLAKTVRDTVVAALEHGDYPFPLLVERLQPERDPSRSPLFQVAFTWNKLDLFDGSVNVAARTGERDSPQLSLRLVGGGQQGANFDLELAIAEGAGALGGWWRYNTALFDAASIARFSRQYPHLLEAIVRHPHWSVIDLPLVASDERQQLLHAWNPRSVEPAGDERTLSGWFEDQVARTPEAIAASCEGDTLTFAELNARANQLAHLLRSRGVGPETTVGLCVGRGLPLVVGIVAIVKAGGAYVPVDPAYPADRVRFILEDARARVVISEESARTALESCTVELVSIDGDAARIADQPATNPPSDIDAQSLAYIIYTSGSTGRPKGVEVTHGHVTRLFTSTASWFDFGRSDVWTLFHSAAFDFSVWELWGALLYGGRIVVVPYWVTRSPESFRALLSREGVTVLNQTPSAFRQLIEADERSDQPLALRYVIFGGEALNVGSLAPWVERHGARTPTLVNMYGITETTVHVTYRPLSATDIFDGTGSVIGEPIPDLTVYVLDSQLEPVPVGMRGELYVGGAGVSRGYLGRPRLTAERFIPDPFGPAGGRLYRTGDLARRTEHGDLAYLGRIDQQVKVRGFRIELGEIEQAIRAHSAIREAVVGSESLENGDTRLVAYVVPDSDAAGPVRRLAAWERHGRLNGRTWCDLPNGFAVVHLNRNETDFLYEEIFGADRYRRHGIELRPGACVFDVGANIGLFSLYIADRYPGATIYAFEPIPPVCDLLELNAELHGLDVHVSRCGVSNKEGEAEFTYYPNVSIFSGLHGDAAQERAVVEAFVRNQEPDQPSAPELLGELLADRLVSQTITCPLTTISTVIRNAGVQQIDLLKVDVEKSELEALEGIEREDWPKIRQVIVEVHDHDGRLAAVFSLLRSRGYDVVTEQDPTLAGTNLFSVYARRPSPAAAGAGESTAPLRRARWTSPTRLVADLRARLNESLPDYMVPSAFVVLDQLPLTSNGKLDRRALPAAAPSRRANSEPRTALERQLAEIWREVLRLESVGLEDDFFAIGGHSLLATKVISRLRSALSVDIPLRTLFETPTIEGLALAVVAQQAAESDPEAFRRALAEIEGG